jgi:hypothetical protein
MSQPRRVLITQRRIMAALALLALAALALSGCARPAPITPVPPTATVYAPPPTPPAPTPPAPTPAALDFPIAAPSAVAEEPANDQTCVDCHTNEETLKAVAEEEEVAESLSEGEG